MPWVYLLRASSILLLLIGGAIVCNYWFLALVSLACRRSGNRDNVFTPSSFAIVVPAHNEEHSICKTLRSCQELDYPKDRYAIYVIADNCSDRTAQMAKNHGVECLERSDSTRRGKGYALEFAFERIDLDRYDAVVVLDADCVIDLHALRVFNRYLMAGDKALQANDIASNPNESATSYVLAVGNCIENELFYAPRSHLGWSVLLRGTGMVLHRDILRQFPWRAHSIVEDAEYAVTLARGGVPVRFVKEVGVRSEFPSDRTQLQVQRTRWASGNLGFAKKYAVRLMWEGLRKRQWALFDIGWTFFVLSRPLVILVLLLPLVLTLASTLLAPGRPSLVLLGFSLTLLVLLLGYFHLGIIRLGVTSRRLWLLLTAPGVILKLVIISIAGLFGVNQNAWARMPRQVDDSGNGKADV